VGYLCRLNSGFSKIKLSASFLSFVLKQQKSAFGASSPFVPGFPDFGALGFILRTSSPTEKLNAKKFLGIFQLN
jgi:hypothetical protein